MATKLTKAPLLRNAARGYAKLAPISGSTNYELKSTTLPNKLVVISAENDSPVTRVSIVFRAGSRNETQENLGVTHVLRNCAGLSTKHVSQFLITRNIQQLGASLTATSDRETISYTLEGTRQAVEKALPFFTEVATQQVFKPWEVAEIAPRLNLDIATRPLQLRAIDLLHKAAFRRGLGNSLYIPKFQIGKISSETLQHYVASNCTSGRAAVVGLGIDHSELTKIAQQLTLETSAGASNPSPYKGGEVRSDKGGDLAFVAIAGEGAPLTDQKKALSFAVLQKAFGTGPQVKWSARDNGLITKAISGGAGNVDYASSAINCSYSDTGLFGVLLAIPSKSAAGVVGNAVKLLKTATVSEEDVNRGKNQLKTSILLEGESGAQTVENIGTQAVINGCALSLNEVASLVDCITTADVNSALSQVKSSKLTIASVGNLNSVPYLDEL